MSGILPYPNQCGNLTSLPTELASMTSIIELCCLLWSSSEWLVEKDKVGCRRLSKWWRGGWCHWSCQAVSLAGEIGLVSARALSLCWGRRQKKKIQKLPCCCQNLFYYGFCSVYWGWIGGKGAEREWERENGTGRERDMVEREIIFFFNGFLASSVLWFGYLIELWTCYNENWSRKLTKHTISSQELLR